MNEQASIPSNNISFINFLFKNKRHRTILKLALAAIILQFAIFKYYYPFASYIHGDSFSYIEAAYKNLDINTYMVGYSRFLRLFSVFTNSDIALVTFQYIFIQCSMLFLLFTIFYFNRLSRTIQIVLISFMVLNPLFLHLANLISSDCLFAGLSLVWFALLLWIIHKPTNTIILSQAIVLFIAFTVRYNALIYPLITGLAYLLSALPVRKKLYGIGIGVLLCSMFVVYTSHKYKLLTGFWQYSPFSGWQLANNAMYAYRYVEVKDRKKVPKKFQELDNMVREYFDSTRDTNKFPIEKIQASTFYMWSPKLTLFKYRNSVFKKDSTADELKKWSSMGPFYKAYGLNIISNYPSHFARHFLWPNLIKYYAPPIEFLRQYNSGKNQVAPIAKNWFSYKSIQVNSRFKNNNVWILNFYPVLSGIINIVMFFILLCYLILKGWITNKSNNKGIVLGSLVWIINAVFTITASSAALRFQSFPLILTTTFSLILIDWLWSASLVKEKTNSPFNTDENIGGNISNQVAMTI